MSISTFIKILQLSHQKSGQNITLIAKLFAMILSFFFFALLALFSYNEEYGSFLQELNANPKLFDKFLIVASIVILLIYHFYPVPRRSIRLIQKYHPLNAGFRFLFNFLVNNIRLSNITILGSISIFFIVKNTQYNETLLDEAIFYFTITLLVIFLTKELLDYHVPSSPLILAIVLLPLLDIVYFFKQNFILNPIFEVIMLTATGLFIEQSKQFRLSPSSLYSFINLNVATLLLPIRNTKTLKLFRFITVLEIATLICYPIFTLDFLKKIAFLSMLATTSLFTNYGINVFGMHKELSSSVFSRPFKFSHVVYFYIELMFLFLIVQLLISSSFFLAYSLNPIQDICFLFLISAILLLAGLLLSIYLPVPVSIDNGESQKNQNQKAAYILASIVFLFVLGYFFYPIITLVLLVILASILTLSFVFSKAIRFAVVNEASMFISKIGSFTQN